MKLIVNKNSKNEIIKGKCSFCKVEITDRRIQDTVYGGRTCCKKCINKVSNNFDTAADESLGEEQATASAYLENILK